MSNKIFLFALVTLITYSAKGQKGNNQLKLIAEVGIINGHNKPGFGGFIKGYLVLMNLHWLQ